MHRATSASFTANVDIVLRTPPRIAVESTNSAIAIAYLNAAGIPDRNGNVWSSSSPNILTQTMIACGSATSCAGDSVVGNGALFTSGACSTRQFDIFVTPHNPGYSYSLTDPTNTGTQAYAELDFFTYEGGGWTATCYSIQSNENRINDLYRNGSTAVKALFKSSLAGGMLTQAGIPAAPNVGGTWTVNMPGLPIAQAVATSVAQVLPGGLVQDWHAPDGTSSYAQYWPTTERVAYFLGSGVQYDFALNGPYHGGTGRGKITFLGGHSYSTTLPYATNFAAPYLRLFYNSLFFNGAAVANLGLTTTPTSIPQGNATPLMLTLQNTGSSPASVTQPLAITLQPGTTYVSTTGTQPTSVAAGPSGTTVLTYPALGTVAAGASPIVVNATGFATTVGAFQTATLAVQYADLYGESFGSSGCTSATVAGAPGAVITKTPASQGPASVGGVVTWTLSYSNPGSSGLLNPYVEDTLPSAFAYASATPAPAYVVPVTGGTKVRWNLASPLAAGGSGTITLRATVRTATGQPFTNVAAFAGTDASGSSFSSSASATVSVSAPEATLAKSVSPSGSVAAGATLTYSLSPSSPGPTLFSNLRFFDPLPANTTFVSATQGGTYGAYAQLAAVDGDAAGPSPSTLVHLTAGATPFTYGIGSTVTVTEVLTNRDPNNSSGFDITSVTPAALVPSDGVSTCTGPLPSSVSTLSKGNGTATFTFTCTVGTLGEITWDGDASGTYNGAPYDFTPGTSTSVLGVSTATGSNVVSWRPTTDTSSEAVPSTSYVAGTGPGVFAFNGSTAVWERYDTAANSWITSPGSMTNLPGTTADGAALVYDGGGYVNGYIYALRGGSVTFWRYKLSAGTAGSWTAMASAPFTVGGGGALARLGGVLYALRGGTPPGSRSTPRTRERGRGRAWRPSRPRWARADPSRRTGRTSTRSGATTRRASTATTRRRTHGPRWRA